MTRSDRGRAESQPQAEAAGQRTRQRADQQAGQRTRHAPGARTHIACALLLAAYAWSPCPAQALWHDHLSYAQPQHVVSVGPFTVAANDAALCYHDADNERSVCVNKCNFLSSTAITALGTDGKHVLVGYLDGLVDIFDPVAHTTECLTDLYVAGSKYPEKSISCFANRAGRLYAGFPGGILEVDPVKVEVRSLWPIISGGARVIDMAILDDRLVALTNEALYVAQLDAAPLEDFAQWHRTTLTDADTKLKLKLTHMAASRGRLLVTSDKATSRKDTVEAALHLVNLPNDYPASVALDEEGQELPLTTQRLADCTNLRSLRGGPNGFALTYSDRVQLIPADHPLQPQAGELRVDVPNTLIPNVNVNDAEWRDDGNVALANAASGILLINPINGVQRQFLPQGPISNSISHVLAAGNDVYVAHPGSPVSVSALSNGFWINSQAPGGGANFLAVDPNDNSQVWLATLNSFVWRLHDKRLEDSNEYHFTPANTAPQNLNWESAGHVDVLGLDREGNLYVHNGWMTSLYSNHVRDASGNWWRSRYGPQAGQLYENNSLTVTSNGNVWLISSNKNFFTVYNINGTPDDANDDVYLTSLDLGRGDRQMLGMCDFADSSSGDRVGAYPTCCVQDREGDVWLATNGGILITHDDATCLYDGKLSFTRVVIPRNDGSGLADYLLDGVTITALAVDGGNRKWIGTVDDGLYLVSPDGLQTVEHFTATNSPLLSNQIVSLTLTDQGELYVATNMGLQSYTTDAAAPVEEMKRSELTCYPNPVEPGEGIDRVQIDGLMDGSHVIVADAEGHAVWRGTAIGGKATWDLRRFGGQRVAPGVYLVFGCGPDGGKQRAKGKILVK